MPRRLALVPALLVLTLIGCSADTISGPDLIRGRLGLAAGGRIAFHSEGDIYVMNDDGTGVTNLTNHPDWDDSPAWSPDGTKIAFTRQSSAPPYPSAIHVMDADGSNVVNITSGGGPVWSPDGTKLAFTRYTPATGGDIYVINADGTNLTQLTSGTYSDGIGDWSVNDEIVFTSDRDDPGSGYNELYVMNSDGTSQTRITFTATSEQSPDWSPDGTRIAFDMTGGATNGIWVIDADGANATQLTGSPRQEPSWSPDGTQIAFAYNGNEIYVIDADGTNETNLTNNGTNPWEQGPDWGLAGVDPVDGDGDGIHDTVDESPLAVSDRFSDIPLGGATVGRVTSVPANTAYVIEDAPDGSQGVKVTLTATGPLAAGSRLRINLDGKLSTIRLAVPGTYIVTDPETDTTVEVTLDGPAELELSLNGAPLLISIAEGSSATITETTDANGDLQDVAVTDVTGDPGGVTVNGEEVEPGADPLALASLQVRLKVTRGFLRLTGTWTPGPSSAADPDTEDVTLKVGPYTFLIPGGLTPKRGGLVFNGTLASEPDVRLSLEMRETSREGVWSVSATGIPVGPVQNPVTVSLRVGDVIGSTITSR